ncbi:MAG: relaxase/mobilization nuclease domain-containing protein, partial [Ruminococcus flavefaciens]|nr:relaxase/mobilization nuclease domain-containing protein [Ruminococcus flavefaciens]
MAITKIIPVKVNPKACVDYVINKDKTNEQTLVSCHGCSEHTADTFFKIANAKNTNQRDDQKQNLAYHFIQSFPPDEMITPEQAHEVGQKYIEELLGGKYAFVMSTHVDKGHVHNHFVVCAAELNMSGKK